MKPTPRKLRSEPAVRVSAADAKANLPSLLKRVQAGERITITHYNKPIADLVPTENSEYAAPRFGLGKGKVPIIDPNWKKKARTDAEVEAWLEGKFW